MIKSAIIAAILGMALVGGSDTVSAETATMASDAPVVDGVAGDPAWQAAKWHPLDKHILGDQPSATDFSGRYKLSWDAGHLYILAEITDDILFDQHENQDNSTKTTRHNIQKSEV